MKLKYIIGIWQMQNSLSGEMNKGMALNYVGFKAFLEDRAILILLKREKNGLYVHPSIRESA